MNSDYSSALGLGGGLFATCCWFLGLLLGIFVLVALWKVYVKAGKPGWAAIIPIYNILVLLEIVGKPWWWLLLMFIPFVNIVIMVIVYIELAKSLWARRRLWNWSTPVAIYLRRHAWFRQLGIHAASRAGIIIDLSCIAHSRLTNRLLIYLEKKKECHHDRTDYSRNYFQNRGLS